MSGETRLGDVLTLRRRFLRSVSLERDARGSAGLDGYIPTPSARAALARIEGALADPGSRAVTITGPYGTGKSAFALYLTHQLSLPPYGTREDGLLPVLITGGREPIIPSLLRGLETGITGQPSLDVQELTAKETAARFAEAAVEAKKRYPNCSGLLVIVDELGKFLEFAAQYPERSDLQVLQEIAEMASRSEAAPVLFVTVLHQSFDEYAHRLSAVQRAEWQKVQGRFLDLPFGDSTEDNVRLIGRAFEEGSQPEFALERAAEQARAAAEFGLLPRGLEQSGETAELFAGAFGLHPVALLALPHLFKRFGQSERSLFSFLNSDDPHGFATFRESAPPSGQYRVDALYDFVTAAFGPSLYGTPGYGKLWSQVQEAVYRCENRGGELDARVVKTVGLLHLLGETARLLPSAEVVRFALADEVTSPADIQVALDRLTRATVLTFRQFKNAYRPYEGSDIDVEERLREARSVVGGRVSPAAVAEKRLPAAPIVARRHSFKTGTLRFFDVRACTPEDLEPNAIKPPEQGDGLLLLCLAADPIEQETVVERARALTDPEKDRPHLVVAAARVSEALLESAFLVEALGWIRENTPELSDDPVASREVQERLQEAAHAFENEWARLIQTGQETQFVWQGETVELMSGGHALQRFLSDACAKMYPQTPTLRNELLNRRQLSSTAAAARRNLVEAMITRRDQESLGIQGYPAERMMYETLLSATGLHAPVEGSGAWDFFPTARPGDPKHISPAWRAVEEFLLGGDLKPRPVTELYALLRARPYGITDGVLPVLLVAALLCWDKELLVYENGALVTQLDPALAERLLRRPQDYTVLGVRIAGERQAALNRFAKGLLRASDSKTIVSVIRALFTQVGRLPAYTRTTQNLSPRARALRDALKEAKNPERLLFSELPELLGAKPLTAGQDDANVDAFFAAWNVTFRELMDAYPALLKRTEETLVKAFGADSVDDVRQRARDLAGRVLEPRLVAFVTRLADPVLAGEAWLESVAAGVVGRPPESWHDADEAKFATSLPGLVSAFRNAELVAFAMEEAQDDRAADEKVALRISVAAAGGQEDARVVVLSKRRAQQAEDAVEPLKKALQKALKEAPAEVRVVALAYLARELLRDEEREK